MDASVNNASRQFGANAMPAPTWHRLKVSDAVVDLPDDLDVDANVSFELNGVELSESPEGADTLFDEVLARFQESLGTVAGEGVKRAVETAALSSEESGNLDIPALSAYQRESVLQEISGNVFDSFSTGMGEEAYGLLAGWAGGRVVLAAPEGTSCSATVRIGAAEGCCSAACIDVVVEAGASLSLLLSYEGQVDAGVVGSGLRAFVGEGAHLEVQSVQALLGDVAVLEDSGYVLAPNAHAVVGHRVLGGAKAYTGLAADLRGDNSRIDISTRYIGASRQERDFNYSVKQRGKCTESSMDANGVLSGSSRKTLRGTIDFVHGCKGSVGNERETVLLADQDVQNKTVPVILCDEDDVMGNHGATIGHVRPEQHFYLNCRGLSDAAIESLFSVAALEEAYVAFPDEQVRHQISLLAADRGIDAQEFSDSEEGEA